MKGGYKSCAIKFFEGHGELTHYGDILSTKATPERMEKDTLSDSFVKKDF